MFTPHCRRLNDPSSQFTVFLVNVLSFLSTYRVRSVTEFVMFHRPMSVFVILFAISANCLGKEAMYQYPETRRVDQVDTFHGVEVADPYRWLEDDVRSSPEVAAWVKAQNTIARKYLDAIPERKEIQERLTKLWNFERYSVPTQTAGKYFYMKNNGLQNQAVLYVADDATSEGRVLIDPNTWSEDGTIALGFTNESDDAKYLAYGRKEAGSDWSTIYVMEVETGKQLDDKLEWVRWGDITWNAEGTGFYYVRYPEPAEGRAVPGPGHRPGDSLSQARYAASRRPAHL